MAQDELHAYWVIAASFFVAYVLAVLPLPRWLLAARPEWVVIHRDGIQRIALPHRVGILTALIVGVGMDVLEGAVLGQNALALIVVALLSLMLYQRLRVFSLSQQVAVVFVLVGIHQLICQWVQNLEGAGATDFVFLLPAVTSALLWPVALHSLRALRRQYRVS